MNLQSASSVQSKISRFEPPESSEISEFVKSSQASKEHFSASIFDENFARSRGDVYVEFSGHLLLGTAYSQREEGGVKSEQDQRPKSKEIIALAAIPRGKIA